MLPVLLITLVAFVSHVSPSDININVDQAVEQQGSPNDININVDQKIRPSGDMSNPHPIFGLYTIEKLDSSSKISTCLSGDTGLIIPEADVPKLSIFAVADEPSCNDVDGPLEEFFANLTMKVRDIIKKKGLDPITLPSAHVSFSKKIWPITFHGDATADNGYFKGLATINFCGQLTKDEEDRVNGIKLSASFTELKGHYDLEASFMFIKIGAGVTLVDDNPTLSISTSLDRVACRLQITDLLTDIGDISLTVCGLGPLDWILEHVVDGVGAVARDFIKGLGNSLKDLINEGLNAVNLSPIGGILGCEGYPNTLSNQTEIIITTTLLA